VPFDLTGTQAAIITAVAAAAAWLFRKNYWRALLFLRPSSVEIEADAPADAKVRLPDALIPLADELTKLPVPFIGTHYESPRFAPPRLIFDYGSREAQTFVSLFVEDGEPRAELLTPLQGGGFVRTGNYRRTAIERAGRYFSGYMENVPLDRLLRAHQRQLASFGVPAEGWDLTARVQAAKAWYQGHGAREVRQQNAPGLLWTVGSLGMVAAAIFAVGRNR
jgi:hypothetical protein